MLLTIVFAAGAVFANQCSNDFIGFQPAEKLKYDSKGDPVERQARPNERAVCFDLESKDSGRKYKNDPNRDDEVGESTTCEICVGTPGHLKCKDGIENLMELSKSRVMDCVEDVPELNIADVWVKMGEECDDALWIDALLVWAAKWTCTNPTAETSYKHNGKTFKPTAPKTENTKVAYGKSNNYGWCLSNNPADAIKWNKGTRGTRYRQQKVLGDTCYPVLRFTIDGGQPVVQGYASADLLEAAELEAIKALWQQQLPRGRRRLETDEEYFRRRSEVVDSEEYISLKKQFRRRVTEEPSDELVAVTQDIVLESGGN